MSTHEAMAGLVRQYKAEQEEEDTAARLGRDAGLAAGHRWKREADPEDWDRLSRWAHHPDSFGPGDQHGAPSTAVLLYWAATGEDGDEDTAASYWTGHGVKPAAMENVAFAKGFIEGATGVRM